MRLAPAAALLLSAGLAAPATVDPGAPLSEWAVMARLAPQSLLLDVARSGDRAAGGRRARAHPRLGRRRPVVDPGEGADAGAAHGRLHARQPARVGRGPRRGGAAHPGRRRRAGSACTTLPRTSARCSTSGSRTPSGAWPPPPTASCSPRRDGGDSWQARAIREGDDFHLNQLAAAADGTLYIAAEAGHLYRSDDGGVTWLALPSPYAGLVLRRAAARRRPRARLRAARPPVLVGRSRPQLDADRDRAPRRRCCPRLQTGPGRFVVAGMEGTLVWGEGASAGRSAPSERPDRQAIVALAPGAAGRPAARRRRRRAARGGCRADAEAHARRAARAADLRPPPRRDRRSSSWPRPSSAGRPRACASTPASPSCCRSSTRTWRRS